MISSEERREVAKHGGHEHGSDYVLRGDSRMITYKCDRCGKPKVKGSLLFQQGLTVSKDFDLCADCLKSFKRWLKGKEEEGERE